MAREMYEAAIRSVGSDVENNLRGFACGLTAFPDEALPGSRKRDRSGTSALFARLAEFPSEAQGILREGVLRLIEFQDEAYANLYIDRLRSLPRALVAEAGRYLALWMAYEDVIRVADLKTRRRRFEQVRRDADAADTDVVHIVEFLKPGIEEVAAILPPRVGRWVRGARWRVGPSLRISSTSLWGFLLLRTLAGLQRWRRHSLRFAEENVAIEDWLARIKAASPALAAELIACARVRKGYSDTLQRGVGLFEMLMKIQDPVELRHAREAALATL